MAIRKKSISQLTDQYRRIVNTLGDAWGDYGGSQANAYIRKQAKNGYIPWTEYAYELQGVRAEKYADKQIAKRKKQAWDAYNRVINQNLALANG